MSTIPADISAERSTALALKHEYRTAAAGALRRFFALRAQAPGVIAEFLLGAFITGCAALLCLRELNINGLFPVVAFCIGVVAGIATCFWIARRIWRAIGLSNRDRLRALVQNLPGLGATLVLMLAILGGLLGQRAPSAPAQTPAAPSVKQHALVKAQQSHVLPMAQRTYRGPDWLIPHDEYKNYITAPLRDAAALCEAQSGNWRLAKRPDFLHLEAHLKEAGQAGYFWADAVAAENASVTYVLNDSGAAKFLTLQLPPDKHRQVLCVAATGPVHDQV